VVSLGKGFRFSKGNMGKESLVTAANIVALGPSHSSILHILEPCGVAHILIVASLSKVWDHTSTLELSIGSHKIKDLLLTIQIVGVVGIQVNIKVSHKDWGISIGGVLVECVLNMSMEISQALWTW